MKEGEDALYVTPDPVGEDISRIEMLKRLNILASGNKTSHKVQFNDSFDDEELCNLVDLAEAKNRQAEEASLAGQSEASNVKGHIWYNLGL